MINDTTEAEREEYIRWLIDGALRERATEPLGSPQSHVTPQAGTILWYAKGGAFGALIIGILVGIVDAYNVPQEWLPFVLVCCGIMIYGLDRLTRERTR